MLEKERNKRVERKNTRVNERVERENEYVIQRAAGNLGYLSY